MLDKLKAFFMRSRTVFVARMYTLAGALVAAYDGLGPLIAGQDFTPVTTRLMDVAHVPSDYRSLVLGVGVAVTGEVFVYMRKITTQPLDPNPPGAG